MKIKRVNEAVNLKIAKNIYNLVDAYYKEVTKIVKTSQVKLISLEEDVFINSNKSSVDKYSRELKMMSRKLQFEASLKNIAATMDKKLNKSKNPDGTLHYIETVIGDSKKIISSKKKEIAEEKQMYLNLISTHKDLINDDTILYNIKNAEERGKKMAKTQKFYTNFEKTIKSVATISAKSTNGNENIANLEYQQVLNKFLKFITKCMNDPS